MKRQAAIIAGTLAVLLCLQASSGKQRGTADLSARPVVHGQAPRLVADYGKVPLHFIPNEGQLDGPAAFFIQGRDKAIYFAPGGLTLALSRPRASTLERWVVKLDFMGADPEVIPVSLEGSGAVVSFFKGGPEDWKAGLKASSKIIYRRLWPGIDLVYYGTVDRLKYEFIVHPGADPSRIRLACRGAESVTLTAEGRLAVTTPAGAFEDDIPAAWQDVKGTRKAVDMAYRLEQSSEGVKATPGEGPGLEDTTRVFGFEVGAYDRGRTLVLDPAVLIYCGYLGGSGWDEARAIAVDAQGNAYVTGYTGPGGSSFPEQAGPDLTYNGDPSDAFVAKVKADGTGLDYCGYLGGGGQEEGQGIAVDAEGNAYVTGQTSSTDFPLTPGSELARDGGLDAYVAKVKADGTGLVYSGRIGGTKMDVGYAIAVDGSGNAYVTGWTDAGLDGTNDLPVTVGPDLTYNGGQDVFVAKVKADGSGFVFCGYLGGWAMEEGYGIAVDLSGNVYLTGRTASPGDAFPVKVGPDLTHNEYFDAFVAKVKADGTEIVYCGYIGGYYDDIGRAIAVDGSGNAYVAGITDYEQGTFPVKVGPDLTYNGGAADAFVAKVKADGSSLDYCGYIGGDAGDSDYGLDYAYGIAVDGAGNAYVAGTTGCPETSFPVVVGPDLTFNGGGDAFVAKVNAAGTALSFCGYIGGEFEEACLGIALDGLGNAYVAGVTISAEATFPVTIGPDLTLNGSDYNDVFVAKISSEDVPGPTLTSLLPAAAEAGEPGFTLSVTGTGFENGAVVRWDGDDLPTTYLGPTGLSAEVGASDADRGRNVVVTVQNPDGGASNALEFSLINPAPSLTSFTPTQTMARGQAFVMTLLGSNFVANSTVHWAGGPLPSLYISGTELWAAVDPGPIMRPGLFPVTVVNPPPGGGTSNPISFAVSGFTLGASSSSATVTAGQSATYTILVSPQYGPYDSAVILTYSGLPHKCTAFLSARTVTPGANPVPVTMTLTTAARTEATAGALSAASTPVPPDLGFPALLLALGLWLRLRRPASAKLPFRRLSAAALLCLIAWTAGCGAGGGNDHPYNDGTPAGTYQIIIEGNSDTLRSSTTITLTVR